MKNCEMIRAHNREAEEGKYSFTLASNGLADMVNIQDGDYR